MRSIPSDANAGVALGSRRVVYGVSAVFFVSGVAGLIFEIVWLQRCGLVFGNSIWSTSLVLSSYMGGLAIGNALVGRYAHRIGNFLRAYAALEATVGVTGIALTYGLVAMTGLLAPMTRGFIDHHAIVNTIRLAGAITLLVVPTTAMGATLPVLVAACSRSREDFGPVLGRLYGWNTFGAVTGVLLAEFVLIDWFGVIGGAWVAALLDGGAAAAAWVLASRPPFVAGPSTTPAVFDRRGFAAHGATERADSSIGFLLSCAFVAGGVLMALEVVWFRFLSLFVVASTLSVALMLAVVLAAIAIGGFVAARWLRARPDATGGVPVVALSAAGAVVASYVVFAVATSPPWAAEWPRILWFACVLALPTAVASGMLFAVIGAAIRGASATGAVAASSLTVANTAGGALGPLIAAFVLLPHLGIERSVFALAAAYLVVVALGVAAARRRLSVGLGAATVGAASILALFPCGLMGSRYLPRSVEVYAIDGSRVVATREGPAETIVLMEKSWAGRPLYDRLVTNGFSMSGTQTFNKRYMRYFAYWPMLLHASPLQRVLVACYGLGVTAQAVTTIPSVRSIDVVEISPDIVATSDAIYASSDNPLHDSRVHLHLDDARFFLQATGNRYDLITGEPPPPLAPGTVNLYTREYFQLLRSRLAPGGVATYWLPVARRGEYDVKSIIRAFCDAFEDCSLWNGTAFDWMLVGTNHLDTRASLAAFTAAWDDPRVIPLRREIGFEVPEQVGATFLGDADDLRKLTADTPPLTDDWPRRLRPAATRLSLLAARTEADREIPRNLITTMVDTRRARQAFERSPLIRRLWPAPLAAATLPFFAAQSVINRITLEGANPLRDIEELHWLLTATTLRRPVLWELGSDDVQQQIAQSADDQSGMVEYEFGVRAFAARQYDAAAKYLAQSYRRGLRVAALRPLLAYTLALGGHVELAAQLVPKPDQALSVNERHFWRWLVGTFKLPELPDNSTAIPD
jgi:spermidine synthase